jgi:hypothetical protein
MAGVSFYRFANNGKAFNNEDLGHQPRQAYGTVKEGSFPEFVTAAIIRLTQICFESKMPSSQVPSASPKVLSELDCRLF